MKYQLVPDECIEVNGRKLHRVRRLKDGLMGGWAESELNLSHVGKCFVYGEAQVSGNGVVSGDSRVFGRAKISGEAQVSGNARVSGDAVVTDNAKVTDHARVYGAVRLSGTVLVCGDTVLYGNAVLAEGVIGKDAEPDPQPVKPPQPQPQPQPQPVPAYAPPLLSFPAMPQVEKTADPHEKSRQFWLWMLAFGVAWTAGSLWVFVSGVRL